MVSGGWSVPLLLELREHEHATLHLERHLARGGRRLVDGALDALQRRVRVPSPATEWTAGKSERESTSVAFPFRKRTLEELPTLCLAPGSCLRQSSIFFSHLDLHRIVVIFDN